MLTRSSTFSVPKLFPLISLGFSADHYHIRNLAFSAYILRADELEEKILDRKFDFT